MKNHRFEGAAHYFRCPHCQEPLHLQERSLLCVNRHCFDLAKQGYVNLAPQAKPSKNYHKTSFENRQRFLEKGYYGGINQAVYEAILSSTTGEQSAILDVGCGEGYYSRRLAKEGFTKLLAFDLSKDSILLAARSEPTHLVQWFVGDLTALPIGNESMDIILDVFSPAHYQEFSRVLKAGGRVLKVVPGPNHLKELRHLARGILRKQDYDNQAVTELFQSSYQLVEQRLVGQTYPISPEDVVVLADMTPLFFHVDVSQLDLTQVREITIEGLLLIGEKVENQSSDR